MLLTIDAQGFMLAVNTTTAAELGYPAEELIGQPVAMIFHPDDQALAERQLAACLRRPGEVFRWELRKVRKNGSFL